MDIEDWQKRTITLNTKINTRNIIIGVLIFVILGLVYTLVHSMNGWKSTKSECADSKDEIREIRKQLFEQKLEQDIKCQPKNLLSRW